MVGYLSIPFSLAGLYVPSGVRTKGIGEVVVLVLKRTCAFLSELSAVEADHVSCTRRVKPMPAAATARRK